MTDTPGARRQTKPSRTGAEPTSKPSGLDRPPSSRLPSPPARILGRNEEIALIEQLLERTDVRLLTLVGPPGIGKTRLALAVSQRLTSHFADGVFLVDLAPTREARLVPHAIAQTLDIADAPHRPILPRLMEALEEKRLLLILDNFEHVLDAATPVAEVLAACSGLKVLATSREPLHLTWERQFPVPPLAVPDLSRLPDLTRLAKFPAVALFLDRGQAVRPDLVLTAQNARGIAELCVRLDGLPLAIEMAAAQVKAMTPEEILRRLDQGLDVLVARASDLPARHRTLSAAIAWSYALLQPGEQALFRRLAVFVGGCTRESATAVCNGDLGVNAAESLAALADKSLLRHDPMPDGNSRFRMLESLREFGMERLIEAGEQNLIRRRHADFFWALVEGAEPELHSRQQSAWLDVLEGEYPNITAALQSYLALGDIDSAMRLAGMLGWFWYVRGWLTEGQEWLERVISAGPNAPPALRAKVISGAGDLAFGRGEFNTMARHIGECESLFRQLDDERGLAQTRHLLAYLSRNRDDDNAGGIALLEEALTLYRRAGDQWGIASSMWSIAHFALSLGDHDHARRMAEEGLILSRQVGAERETGLHLLVLGRIARDLGDPVRAEVSLEEALALSRRIGDKHFTGMTLIYLGLVQRDRGDHSRADECFQESATLLRELNPRGGWTAVAIRNLGAMALLRGDRRRAAGLLQEALTLSFNHPRRSDVATCLEVLAEMDAHKHSRRAAKLFGAAAALRVQIGVPVPPADRPAYERTAAAIRAHLSGAAYDAELAAGWAMSIDEGVVVAMSGLAQEDVSPDARPGDVLSRREREVAMLVAQGLSNRQIAAALFVAETTAESHVQSILNKLGFHKRAQIAAWVAAHRLGSASH